MRGRRRRCGGVWWRRGGRSRRPRRWRGRALWRRPRRLGSGRSRLLVFLFRRCRLRQQLPASTLSRCGEGCGLERQKRGAGEQESRHGILGRVRVHIGMVLDVLSERRLDRRIGTNGQCWSIQGMTTQIVPPARDNQARPLMRLRALHSIKLPRIRPPMSQGKRYFRNSSRVDEPAFKPGMAR